MNRENDIAFELAYDAPVTLNVVLESATDPHPPVNVTGYSSRMQILQYDGSEFGAVRLTITSPSGIAVGGVNGLFAATISALQSTALKAVFGNPPPTEPARFRLFATPPAGTEVELAHGAIRLLAPGQPVSTVSVAVNELTYSVNVTALAPAGPAGATGAAGPPGTGIEPNDGKTVTTSTAAVTIKTFAVTTSKTFTAEVTVQARTVDKERVQKWMLTGVCDGAGVVTLDSPGQVSIDGEDLGLVSFTVTAANSVNIQFNPYTATSTSIFVQSFTLTTGT